MLYNTGTMEQQHRSLTRTNFYTTLTLTKVIINKQLPRPQSANRKLWNFPFGRQDNTHSKLVSYSLQAITTDLQKHRGPTYTLIHTGFLRCSLADHSSVKK